MCFLVSESIFYDVYMISMLLLVKLHGLRKSSCDNNNQFCSYEVHNIQYKLYRREFSFTYKMWADF